MAACSAHSVATSPSPVTNDSTHRSRLQHVKESATMESMSTTGDVRFLFLIEVDIETRGAPPPPEVGFGSVFSLSSTVRPELKLGAALMTGVERIILMQSSILTTDHNMIDGAGEVVKGKRTCWWILFGNYMKSGGVVETGIY